MTPVEQFTQIVEQSEENKIIPFLATLSPQERKTLMPGFKKLFNHYFERIQEGNSFKARGNEAQISLLSAASFILNDRKEFEKTYSLYYIMRGDVLNSILSWYVPSWFSEYINGFLNNEVLPFGYDRLMALTEEGYVIPTPALVARALVPAIYEYIDREAHLTLKILEKRPVTLDEHIWLLFEYECGVNWADRYVRPKISENIEPNWLGVFKKCSDNGQISRERVLRSSLAASARNFTKPLCGWFADLVVLLKPTSQELLSLQQELLAVLSGPQSKPANMALGYLKEICADPAFDKVTFIQQAEVLLAGEVKSIHAATLGILEILAKSNRELQEQICIAVAQSFISPDASTQTKAARLIAKYGDTASAALKEKVSAFGTSLLTATKEIMMPWLQKEEQPSATEQIFSGVPGVRSVLNKDVEIPIVNDVEELIFLMSQAMDNNQHYHFEQILSGALRCHPRITSSHLRQMEPAMQRAIKVIQKGVTGNAGNLERYLAAFLIEYGLLLEEQFPGTGVFGKQRPPKIAAEKWQLYEHGKGAYDPHHQLAGLALLQIRNKEYLPLLSMPTHIGGWIDPVTLVKRMTEYYAASVFPTRIDLQIAIARVAFENAEAALALVGEGLPDEIRQLMLFLLDKDMEPQAPFTHPAVWMMAGLTKAPEKEYAAFAKFPYSQVARAYLTGYFEWMTYNEKYEAYGSFNHEKKEYDRVEAYRAALHINYPSSTNVGTKEYYGQRLLQYNPIDNAILLPEFMHNTNVWGFEKDVARILSLMPNHPDIILARTIGCMSSSMAPEVSEKKMVLEALSSVNMIKPGPSEMLHLFVATSMLHADTTCRALAAEIWIDRVQYGCIDSERIGAIIGTHEKIEWAPMKRFIELATGHMQKVSPLHNEALEKMITACLLQLPDKGIKDLKGLLELYREVLTNNGSSVEGVLTHQLRAWNEIVSLKKVVKTLTAG